MVRSVENRHVDLGPAERLGPKQADEPAPTMGFPTPPVVRGVGLTPLPRLDRLYFWLGEPIDSAGFGSRFDDTAAARALRDEVKRAILSGIQFLRDERDQDPDRGLTSRLLHHVE